VRDITNIDERDDHTNKAPSPGMRSRSRMMKRGGDGYGRSRDLGKGADMNGERETLMDGLDGVIRLV